MRIAHEPGRRGPLHGSLGRRNPGRQAPGAVASRKSRGSLQYRVLDHVAGQNRADYQPQDRRSRRLSPHALVRAARLTANQSRSEDPRPSMRSETSPANTETRRAKVGADEPRVVGDVTCRGSPRLHFDRDSSGELGSYKPDTWTPGPASLASTLRTGGKRSAPDPWTLVDDLYVNVETGLRRR